MGWVISTEWYSKVEGDRLVRGNTDNVQEGEISKPVPPPWPDGREVCEKEKRMRGQQEKRCSRVCSRSL